MCTNSFWRFESSGLFTIKLFLVIEISNSHKNLQYNFKSHKLVEPQSTCTAYANLNGRAGQYNVCGNLYHRSKIIFADM